MNCSSLYQAYTQHRSDDALHMKKLLEGFSDQNDLLAHVFWNNAVLAPDGKLQTVYTGLPARKKFNVLSFVPCGQVPQIEKCGDFFRLQVTSHRILDLASFENEEAFFSALSQKNRKKLRWLRNTMPKMGCKVVSLEDENGFRMFEKLYCAQFPKYTPGCPANQAVWKIYQELIRQQRSFSFILLSEKDEPISAALGYFDGASYNYTHLTRSRGEYDKYSPGYYLTYCIIMRILGERPETKFFFMGPGEYDYKQALLGRPFAIYRYERCSFGNIFSLLRMYFRCRKEQKKFRSSLK